MVTNRYNKIQVLIYSSARLLLHSASAIFPFTWKLTSEESMSDAVWKLFQIYNLYVRFSFNIVKELFNFKLKFLSVTNGI